jgi:hypothetical protein
MAATTIILIVFFAVAAILVLVILAAAERVLLNGRADHRRVETDKIRDQAKEETLDPTATVHA